MKARLIQSFFKTKCRNCGAELPKGANIWYAKHHGARCEVCGPHPADSEPLPRKTKAARKPRAEKSGSARKPADAKPLDERADFDPKSRRAVKGADRVHRIDYDSIREIVEEALSDHAQTDGNRELLRVVNTKHLTGEDKWANYFTKDKLLEQVHRPAEKLLKAIDDMREHLTAEVDMPTKPRRKIRRGQDWGDTLDADRILARDPMPWERTDREPQDKRLVKIAVNLSVHCRQKPSEILYRGAATLALADFLTEQGCNVEIVAFMVAGNVSDDVNVGVSKIVVKHPDMPMDVGALAFSLCEIAFYRLVVVIGSARRWPGKLYHGLGHPQQIPQADRDGFDFLVEEDITSESAAVEWLNRCLKKEVDRV